MVRGGIAVAGVGHHGGGFGERHEDIGLSASTWEWPLPLGLVKSLHLPDAEEGVPGTPVRSASGSAIITSSPRCTGQNMAAPVVVTHDESPILRLLAPPLELWLQRQGERPVPLLFRFNENSYQKITLLEGGLQFFDGFVVT